MHWKQPGNLFVKLRDYDLLIAANREETEMSTLATAEVLKESSAASPPERALRIVRKWLRTDSPLVRFERPETAP